MSEKKMRKSDRELIGGLSGGLEDAVEKIHKKGRAKTRMGDAYQSFEYEHEDGSTQVVPIFVQKWFEIDRREEMPPRDFVKGDTENYPFKINYMVLVRGTLQMQCLEPLVFSYDTFSAKSHQQMKENTRRHRMVFTDLGKFVDAESSVRSMRAWFSRYMQRIHFYEQYDPSWQVPDYFVYSGKDAKYTRGGGPNAYGLAKGLPLVSGAIVDSKSGNRLCAVVAEEISFNLDYAIGQGIVENLGSGGKSSLPVAALEIAQQITEFVHLTHQANFCLEDGMMMPKNVWVYPPKSWRGLHNARKNMRVCCWKTGVEDCTEESKTQDCVTALRVVDALMRDIERPDGANGTERSIHTMLEIVRDLVRNPENPNDSLLDIVSSVIRDVLNTLESGKKIKSAEEFKSYAELRKMQKKIAEQDEDDSGDSSVGDPETYEDEDEEETLASGTVEDRPKTKEEWEEHWADVIDAAEPLELVPDPDEPSDQSAEEEEEESDSSSDESGGSSDDEEGQTMPLSEFFEKCDRNYHKGYFAVITFSLAHQLLSRFEQGSSPSAKLKNLAVKYAVSDPQSLVYLDKTPSDDKKDLSETLQFILKSYLKHKKDFREGKTKVKDQEVKEIIEKVKKGDEEALLVDFESFLASEQDALPRQSSILPKDVPFDGDDDKSWLHASILVACTCPEVSLRDFDQRSNLQMGMMYYSLLSSYFKYSFEVDDSFLEAVAWFEKAKEQTPRGFLDRLAVSDEVSKKNRDAFDALLLARWEETVFCGEDEDGDPVYEKTGRSREGYYELMNSKAMKRNYTGKLPVGVLVMETPMKHACEGEKKKVQMHAGWDLVSHPWIYFACIAKPGRKYLPPPLEFESDEVTYHLHGGVYRPDPEGSPDIYAAVVLTDKGWTDLNWHGRKKDTWDQGSKKALPKDLEFHMLMYYRKRGFR